MPDRKDIRPHDGSVMAGAIHLELTDRLIREKLRNLRTYFPAEWEKMCAKTTISANGLNDFVDKDGAVIPHSLRTMLCAIFDIECEFSEADARHLRAGV